MGIRSGLVIIVSNVIQIDEITVDSQI
jgi:hypothetical protein